jgi:hypothetical protein
MLVKSDKKNDGKGLLSRKEERANLFSNLFSWFAPGFEYVGLVLLKLTKEQQTLNERNLNI